MKKVYISGPMTGYPDYNFPAFMAAEAKLQELGYEVINPARIKHIDKKNWSLCMRQAATEMLKADQVATLPGWHRSCGARIEVELAMNLGIPVREIQELIAANKVKNEGFTVDDVGGLHSDGIGYNPQGVYCGECGFETCRGCVNELAKT
ncbi:MAG: DUF4406 domain-containing protein [Desulfitobacterium hafniense]